MYPPAQIVSTTLPRIAGRADESTKGGVFNDVLTPVRGVASKVANEGVESTGSGRPLSGRGGRPVPIAGEAKSGAFCKNVRTASELATAGRERSTVRSCLWYYPTPPHDQLPTPSHNNGLDQSIDLSRIPPGWACRTDTPSWWRHKPTEPNISEIRGGCNSSTQQQPQSWQPSMRELHHKGWD